MRYMRQFIGEYKTFSLFVLFLIQIQLLLLPLNINLKPHTDINLLSFDQFPPGHKFKFYDDIE